MGRAGYKTAAASLVDEHASADRDQAAGEAVEDGREQVCDLGHSLHSLEFARVNRSQPELVRVD